MKLTAAIAHSYPNAEVRFMDIDNIVKVAKMDGIVKDTVHLGIPCNLISIPIAHKFISVEYCQLILTPLDKISDEDAVEVAKLAISKSEIKGFKVVQIRREDYSVKVIIEFDGKDGMGMYWVNITSYGMPQFLKRVGSTLHELHYQFLQCCIDYLRSNGYDCGHGSIPNLIAAGVAVEKEIV